VCNALGFITAAFLISALSTRLGHAKTLMVAETLLVVGVHSDRFDPPCRFGNTNLKEIMAHHLLRMRRLMVTHQSQNLLRKEVEIL